MEMYVENSLLPSGYGEDFISPIDDDLLCSICQLPLREPVLTRCGHRFCRRCLEQHLARQEIQHQVCNCPVDREKLECSQDVFPDKATERKILSFIIKCPNEGCEWTGELREEENHLQSCSFCLVPCANEKCNATIKRHEIEEHLVNTCEWRMIPCDYCSEQHSKCLMQKHVEDCAKVPVECANGCGENILREMGFDKSTVSRVVRRVIKALTAKLGDFINFPCTRAERDEIKQGLFRVAGFPCAIGCIDGTHVRIQAPRENEPDFVNRKGFHSINVQAICDHRGMLTNVVARWPGSTHDSHIFRTSAIGRDLEGTGLGDGVLLGDSGYACSPFLMTPYLNPKTPQEERFNRAHKITRCAIERTFGVLKRRFHVLHSEVRMAPDRVCTIIVACCILHNLAIRLREPDPEDCEMDDEGCAPDLHCQYHGRETGNAVREHIANTFF